VPGVQLKDKIGGLEARKAELTELLANAEGPPPLLHPNMAEIYRQRIGVLYGSLQNEDGKAEAAEVFRMLIDQVTLVPDEAELTIVLRGDLAAILQFAANKINPAVLSEAGFWVPCFRKNRWLRGHATNDPCGMDPATTKIRNRRYRWLRYQSCKDCDVLRDGGRALSH